MTKNGFLGKEGFEFDVPKAVRALDKNANDALKEFNKGKISL